MPSQENLKIRRITELTESDDDSTDSLFQTQKPIVTKTNDTRLASEYVLKVINKVKAVIGGSKSLAPKIEQRKSKFELLKDEFRQVLSQEKELKSERLKVRSEQR